MLRLLTYLMSNGIATAKQFCPDLQEGVRGMPLVTPAPCHGTECGVCVKACPTEAITITEDGAPKVKLDLGSCIACGLCVSECPSGVIVNDRSTRTARRDRDALVIDETRIKDYGEPSPGSLFNKSIAARVVSTGCSACDLELGAAGNPIFDMERFGIHIVASPRFADVLLVTGPVPKAMHDPLRRCYEAMSEPRLVVAVGTCAISGGVHKGGYTEANGADQIVPVDVYIPGCPPHPWSIIYGVSLAMGRAINSNKPA